MSEFGAESESDVLRFAMELEKIAGQLDQGYKEHDESFTRFARSNADFYNLTSNSYSFNAERVVSDEDDEILLTTYKIIGEARFNELSRIAFPDDVWEALQYGQTELVDGELVPTEEWLRLLDNSETRLAIGCDYTVTVTSDGTIEDLLQVYAYVDETPVELPGARAQSSLPMQAQSEASLVAETLEGPESADLDEVFDEDDLKMFADLGSSVLKELQLTMAVDMLYQNIESNSIVTEVGVMNAAKNILKVILPHEEEEERSVNG